MIRDPRPLRAASPCPDAMDGRLHGGLRRRDPPSGTAARRWSAGFSTSGRPRKLGRLVDRPVRTRVSPEKRTPGAGRRQFFDPPAAVGSRCCRPRQLETSAAGELAGRAPDRLPPGDRSRWRRRRRRTADGDVRGNLDCGGRATGAFTGADRPGRRMGEGDRGARPPAPSSRRVSTTLPRRTADFLIESGSTSAPGSADSRSPAEDYLLLPNPVPHAASAARHAARHAISIHHVASRCAGVPRPTRGLCIIFKQRRGNTMESANAQKFFVARTTPLQNASSVGNISAPVQNRSRVDGLVTGQARCRTLLRVSTIPLRLPWTGAAEQLAGTPSPRK